MLKMSNLKLLGLILGLTIYFISILSLIIILKFKIILLFMIGSILFWYFILRKSTYFDEDDYTQNSDF